MALASPVKCDILDSNDNGFCDSAEEAAMGDDTPIRLKVPQQDLDALSVFAPRPEAAHDWAASLPVANPQVVARRLVAALDEINRCKMHPELRFALLGELQDNLLIASASLSRRFLNQPLVMPEELRQLADLVTELYSLSVSAYATVAVETLRERDSVRNMNPARLVCEALLKAMEYSKRKLLLTFQFHQPVAINGWLTLHQLYALAERQELAEISLPGADGETTSIVRIYLEAMMLGCCKPNQLRQADLTAVYRALSKWGQLLKLQRNSSSDALFVVDLSRDQPPLYSALYRDGGAPTCRRIDTTALVAHMRGLLENSKSQNRAGIPLDDNSRIAPGLLAHLVDALGTMSVRNFARKPTSGALRVSFGLSAAHFHAAGDVPFSQVLHGSGYIPPPAERVATNPFMSGEKTSSRDQWSSANPEEDFERPRFANEGESAVGHQVTLDAHTAHAILEAGPELPEEHDYPVYEAQMINASPGGYCLEWSQTLPQDLKAGEIASVQEEPGGQWVIAVVRWISQLPQKRTLLGMELMSPRAKAFGAIIRQKTGSESGPQRVLMLPEIPLVGQAETLITPRAGFYEQQKIALLAGDQKITVQLQRQLSATGSFARFEFRYIRLLGDVIAEDKSGPLNARYDSLWSNI